jgi:thiol-disulfide isomerase/thioredoxin
MLQYMSSDSPSDRPPAGDGQAADSGQAALGGRSPGGGRPPRNWLVSIALVTAAAVVLSTATVLIAHLAASSGARAAGSQAAGKQSAASDGLGFVRLDRQAPDLLLPNLRQRGMLNLTSMVGKPIVVNFWSSTCTVCKSETPALAGVARALGSKVTFVGVDSVDERGPAIAFDVRYKVPYPSMFDPQGTAATKYDVVGLPVTFFLSTSGKTILGENVGALTPAKLRSILQKLYGVS